VAWAVFLGEQASSMLELRPASRGTGVPQHHVAKLVLFLVVEQTQVSLPMKHKCSKPGFYEFQMLLRWP